MPEPKERFLVLLAKESATDPKWAAKWVRDTAHSFSHERRVPEGRIYHPIGLFPKRLQQRVALLLSDVDPFLAIGMLSGLLGYRRFIKRSGMDCLDPDPDYRVVAQDLYRLMRQESDFHVDDKITVLTCLLQNGFPDQDYWPQLIDALGEALLLVMIQNRNIYREALRQMAFFTPMEHRYYEIIFDKIKSLFFCESVESDLREVYVRVCFMRDCIDMCVSESDGSRDGISIAKRNPSCVANADHPLHVLAHEAYWRYVKQLETANLKYAMNALERGMGSESQILATEATQYFINRFPALIQQDVEQAGWALYGVAESLNRCGAGRRTGDKYGFNDRCRDQAFGALIGLLKEKSAKAAQTALSGFRHWSD
ncbi:hypothetical protein [Magnetofaba australis]|uniref:Uncharacterized protein n=1 Tax=Magnetofaba australis IT-1 TaxID=1434232 RepID=A0A1Y2KB84_9PROT|nr:hypothetical protein [Magnetofaba australis]OSM07184.1 hypothetical protein MAIT1_03893 [Magnetofaba australis IT-1]